MFWSQPFHIGMGCLQQGLIPPRGRIDKVLSPVFILIWIPVWCIYIGGREADICINFPPFPPREWGQLEFSQGIPKTTIPAYEPGEGSIMCALSGKKEEKFYHVCTRLVAIFSIGMIEQRMFGTRRKPLAGFQKVIWPSHLGLLSSRLNFKAQMETMQLPETLGCLGKQACRMKFTVIRSVKRLLYFGLDGSYQFVASIPERNAVYTFN
jgi:hypothetical protein